MDQIRSLYYDPSKSSSFGGVERLYKGVNELDPSVSRKEVKNWLSGELTYSLHKPLRFKFPRNRVVTFSANEQWQADLADMSKLSGSNKGNKYILTVIDVFSKLAFAKPIKNKKPESIISAFKEIFGTGSKPIKLQTDRGLEFKNKKFLQFLDQEDVHFFTSKNQTTKCAVVERFNRTLKGRLYRFLTSKGTKNWVTILPQIVASYNNSVHRSIGMRPVDVNEDTRAQVFKNLFGVSSYDELKTQRKRPKLLAGSRVRINKTATTFRRGYLPNWSDHTYKVKSATTNPIFPMYELEDNEGETLLPKLYTHEVQQVIETPEATYKVEKVVRRKTEDGVTYAFIKWKGFPSSFNSWVPENELTNISDPAA
jgi:Integrase core domain/Chromo (CHRromatin Organisation MOdifier) domain